MATLAEIDGSWSYDDVMRANAILDFRIHSQKQGDAK